MDLFKELKSYKDYLNKNPFHKLLKIDLSSYGAIDEKKINHNYFGVDPNLTEAFPAELDDLIRLHYLVRSRKVITILEFGIGKSSIVLDHALQLNKANYSDYINKNIRRINKFECFSVDADKDWINHCKQTAETKLVKFHFSENEMSTFNGRICSLYKNIPNICPDLIYLDGPSQFTVESNIRGISTNHQDRLPMAADILSIEHFLLPGTLIVVDGRTANARFLKSNFQRNWSYFHSEEFDQHFFELSESPLGIHNKKQIDFCLGDDFYKRLGNF